MSAARGVNETFIDDRRSFGERQTFFVDPEFVARALVAGTCVIRSDTLVEQPQPAIREQRRLIVVEAVLNFVLLILRPARRHHLDIAAELVLPKFVARSEIENMNDRLSFEP